MRCDKVDARNSWRVFVCGAVILRLGKITKNVQGYSVYRIPTITNPQLKAGSLNEEAVEHTC